MSFVGEMFALLTALTWSMAVILFRQSGALFSPFDLNLFKNLVGVVCLAATLVLGAFLQIPDLWPSAPWTVYVWIAGSGVLGVAVADTLFFASLNRLGAGGAAIVECLYAPSILIFSYILLGERVGATALVGAVFIIVSVLFSAPAGGHGAGERREYAFGIAYGVLAMVIMGVSLVAVKREVEHYPLVWVTFWRLSGGAVVMLFMALGLRSYRRALRTLRPQPIWRKALPGAVLGTYLALLFWLAGFKYTSASVASLLNQTSTVFTLLLAAWLLKERLTGRRMAAVALGLGGSILVLWSA